MSSAISIGIENVRHGWAEAVIAAGDQAYRMHAFSYTTDAFSDIARFGVDIALDAPLAEVRFDREPAEYRWIFQKKWSPEEGVSCRFRVLEFADFYQNQNLDAGSELLSVDVEPDQLAEAVRSAFRNIESAGVEAFEMAWGQGYPSREVAALDAALSTRRRSNPVEDGANMSVAIIVGDPKDA